MPYANTTLWAQWYNPSGTNYQVIYNGNGNTGGTAPATVNYKQFQGVGPIPDNTGGLIKVIGSTTYTFYGWNTSANGTGTAYPVTSNGFTMPAENVTLYAQWVNTSVNWTLTYDGNGSTGGSVPASPTQYPDGAGVSVLGQTSLVRAGYTFLGWNTAIDGTGANYPIGNSIVMSSDKTLYAQWVGGSVAKSCGSGTGGSSNADIYNSTSRTAYRDTTNDTITVIIPTYFSTSSIGPYGTGDGPIASPFGAGYGNLLSTYATAILSQVAGNYQINVTYTTLWTAGSQVQTAIIILSPPIWPAGETISGITIPTGGAQPASFIFDPSATPSFTVTAGGCFSQISTTTSGINVNATFAGIIAFYINFSNGTSTRVAVGTEFRWGTSTTIPHTYTYTSNYARVELANGPTPGPGPSPLFTPYAGTFTPTATTFVNSA